MINHRPDIISILEKEKQYYADQIRKINIELDALKSKDKSEDPNLNNIVSQKKRIQWRTEIKKLYNKYNELSTEEVQNKLAEIGIAESFTEKGENSIYSTLSRLSKDGLLKKMEQGIYIKKYIEHNKKKVVVATPLISN